jgi:hypothetical protein
MSGRRISIAIKKLAACVSQRMIAAFVTSAFGSFAETFYDRNEGAMQIGNFGAENGLSAVEAKAADTRPQWRCRAASRFTSDNRETVMVYANDNDDDRDLGGWRDPGEDLPPIHTSRERAGRGFVRF